MLDTGAFSGGSDKKFQTRPCRPPVNPKRGAKLSRRDSRLGGLKKWKKGKHRPPAGPARKGVISGERKVTQGNVKKGKAKLEGPLQCGKPEKWGERDMRPVRSPRYVSVNSGLANGPEPPRHLFTETRLDGLGRKTSTNGRQKATRRPHHESKGGEKED